MQSSLLAGDVALGAPGADGGSDDLNGQGGDGDGGVIYADAGTSLTVAGCTFQGDQAIGEPGGSGGTGFANGGGGNGNGSAIDTQGIALAVTSSTFSRDLV